MLYQHWIASRSLHFRLESSNLKKSEGRVTAPQVEPTQHLAVRNLAPTGSTPVGAAFSRLVNNTAGLNRPA